MDQDEFSVPRRDACGRQRVTHRSKSMTLRRRNFSNPPEGRSKSLQLNIKMINFNKFRRRKGPAWSRGEPKKAGASNSGSSSKSSCMVETADSSEPHSSEVREIPGFYYDAEKKRYFKITKDHPGKNFVLCQCGGYKKISSKNHSRVIPGNIKVTKVVETSITTTDNSPSQDCTHPDDQTTSSQ